MNTSTASLDVVVPVLNEEKALLPNIAKLHRYLEEHFGDYAWRIVIADNGSTDTTPDVAKALELQLPNVAYLRLEQRGRGRALKAAWLGSEADLLAYMDVDLSTELDALRRLTDAVHHDGYSVAIASRLLKDSQVIGRPFKRELVSQAYSLILRSMFFTGFRDAQCGFKVLARRAVQDLVPLVLDTGWFFDTELLLLAERNGYRIREMPVTWTDDPDSRVDILKTAYQDMRGLLRLRLGGLRKASKTLG